MRSAILPTVDRHFLIDCDCFCSHQSVLREISEQSIRILEAPRLIGRLLEHGIDLTSALRHVNLDWHGHWVTEDSKRTQQIITLHSTLVTLQKQRGVWKITAKTKTRSIESYLCFLDRLIESKTREKLALQL